MKLATPVNKNIIQCYRWRSPSAATGFHKFLIKREWIGHVVNIEW